MTSPASLVKRLLVGRPVRSDRLLHTLLPKRIALPVFASDPMSSVAYAPAEILLTLSLGGMTAYAFSPWVALVVVLVLLTVVASYRQTVAVSVASGINNLASLDRGDGVMYLTMRGRPSTSTRTTPARWSRSGSSAASRCR